MTLTERVALTLGGVVSLVTLMGGVWWFAISMNDMQHNVRDLTLKLTTVEAHLQEDRAAVKKRTELFRGLERNQTLILTDMVTLVYLDDDNVVMRTADGRTFRVPLTGRPDVHNRVGGIK